MVTANRINELQRNEIDKENAQAGTGIEK